MCVALLEPRLRLHQAQLPPLVQAALLPRAAPARLRNALNPCLSANGLLLHRIAVFAKIPVTL
jgi:hypothetical protein